MIETDDNLQKRSCTACAGLIDRKLSVLRWKGFPSHHSTETVNRHLNRSSWRLEMEDINRSDIAHHLFDTDTTLYYVSNSSGAATHALLAFDIDAKPDPVTGQRATDALSFASAIQDLLGWGGSCFIQPSTSGYGAYLYFILSYAGHCSVTVDESLKTFCRIMKSRLQSRFSAELDAIKGDIPTVLKLRPYKEIACQGTLVRLPFVFRLSDLLDLSTVKYVPFESVLSFLEESGNATACSSGEETPPLAQSSPSLLSSTRDTNAREPGHPGQEIELNLKNAKPLKRVIEALKRFRDLRERTPENFEEFNVFYERCGLNTGAATRQRKERFLLAGERLGPYRKPHLHKFKEEQYDWLEEIISDDQLAEVGRRRKQSLVMTELKLTQYVIGLATVDPQEGDDDFGCPMTRIEKMHDSLRALGLMAKDYGKSGRNRYGCYVTVLKSHDLIEEVQPHDREDHRGRKLIVTEKDPVFGSRSHDRICKARLSKQGRAMGMHVVESGYFKRVRARL